MTGGENADGKSEMGFLFSEEKMDVEKSVRTVDCLRGRLLAERVASRNAKMEAEHLGNKLIELENLLRKEGKARNRAEKKLKSLMKKLESNNISYYSSESGLLDLSDITSTSSLSSTASSKCQDKCSKNSQRKDFPFGSVDRIKFPIRFDNLKCIDSQTSISSESHGSSPVTAKNCSSSEHYSKQGHHEVKGFLSPALGAGPFPVVMNPLCQNSGRSSEIESNQNFSIASIDELSVKPSTEEEVNQENDQDQENEEDGENHADDSLALVAVEKQETKQIIDPEVLGATVKEALDALRHAKEQLHSSMERRKRRNMNMIKVG